MMSIVIAILMLGSVESSLNLDSNTQYKATKKVVQVIRLVHGIR